MTPLYHIRLARLKTHNLILGAAHIVESTTTTHEYTTGIQRDHVLRIVLRILGEPTTTSLLRQMNLRQILAENEIK